MTILSQDQITVLREKLETEGVENVKNNLANNIYGQDKIPHVKKWLDEKKDELTQEKRQRDLMIQNEANTIAKEHNKIAWFSLLVSIIATLISIGAVIISIIALVKK